MNKPLQPHVEAFEYQKEVTTYNQWVSKTLKNDLIIGDNEDVIKETEESNNTPRQNKIKIQSIQKKAPASKKQFSDRISRPKNQIFKTAKNAEQILKSAIKVSSTNVLIPNKVQSINTPIRKNQRTSSNSILSQTRVSQESMFKSPYNDYNNSSIKVYNRKLSVHQSEQRLSPKKISINLDQNSEKRDRYSLHDRLYKQSLQNQRKKGESPDKSQSMIQSPKKPWNRSPQKQQSGSQSIYIINNFVNKRSIKPAIPVFVKTTKRKRSVSKIEKPEVLSSEILIQSDNTQSQPIFNIQDSSIVISDGANQHFETDTPLTERDQNELQASPKEIFSRVKELPSLKPEHQTIKFKKNFRENLMSLQKHIIKHDFLSDSKTESVADSSPQNDTVITIQNQITESNFRQKEEEKIPVVSVFQNEQNAPKIIFEIAHQEIEENKTVIESQQIHIESDKIKTIQTNQASKIPQIKIQENKYIPVLSQRGKSSIKTQIQSPQNQDIKHVISMKDINFTLENANRASSSFQHKIWKDGFTQKLKNSMTKCIDYPGHGSSMLDLHDMFKNHFRADYLIEGLLTILTNEVGNSPNAFDTIVSIDSPQVINLGVLIARRLKLPFASIATNEKLPGQTFEQEYRVKGKGKVLKLQKGIVKENSKVLLVDYLISNGESIKASEFLLQQIKGVSISACLCIFSIPRLNGDKKLQSKLISIVNLDQMMIENKLLNMVLDQKQQLILKSIEQKKREENFMSQVNQWYDENQQNSIKQQQQKELEEKRKLELEEQKQKEVEDKLGQANVLKDDVFKKMQASIQKTYTMSRDQYRSQSMNRAQTVVCFQKPQRTSFFSRSLSKK